MHGGRSASCEKCSWWGEPPHMPAATTDRSCSQPRTKVGGEGGGGTDAIPDVQRNGLPTFLHFQDLRDA